MKPITEHLKTEIPHGPHCNPDTSLFPKWGKNSDDCKYHSVGIYCRLMEEMCGNNKICGINDKEE